MVNRPTIKSLRFRLLVLVSLALLPALVLMVLTARERRVEDGKKVQQEAMRLAIFAASNLERDVLSGRAFLSALVQDLRWPRGGRTGCSEELAALQKKTGLYSFIGVADTTGRILCASDSAAKNARIESTPWFKEAMQTRGFSVGYDGDRILSRKVTIEFAQTFASPEGESVLFFIALDLDWVNELAKRVQLPHNSTLTVLGSQDQVLVRYPDPERWVGNRLKVDPLAGSITNIREGVAEAPGLDGVMRLYAFTEIPEVRLSIRLGIPSAIAFAGADRAMRINLFWLGIGALLALIATWGVGNWMVVRPVGKLVDATRRLGTGNLAARTDMDYSAGELGTLAKAFDEMAESLEWREAQLRESERERQHSEGRFTEMVELASDAIIGVDAGFAIFFFNRGAQRIFGYSPEEVEGRELRLLEPEDAAAGSGVGSGAEAAGLAASLADPGVLRADVKLRTKSGHVFAAEATFSRAERNGSTTYTLFLRERKPAAQQTGVRA